MKKLRILAVMHDELKPPADVSAHDLAMVDWKMEYDVTANLRLIGHDVVNLGIGDDLDSIKQAVRDVKPHLIFNLLEDIHDVGTFDQNVVSYIELLRTRYTGCSSRGLMIARDKANSKALLSYHGILVPAFVNVPRGRKPRLLPHMDFPVIVKSRTKEASQGISQSSVVTSEAKLVERTTYIHEVVGTDAIIEQYIEGREFYVGVMGNQRVELLPLWELHLDKMKARWRIATDRVKWNHSYQLKNKIRTSKARKMPRGTEEKIARICRKASEILGLNGYARLDLRMTADGEVYFMEANPNPQLAYGEDFAEAAEAGGIDYLDLLQKIVQLGLRWDAAHLG